MRRFLAAAVLSVLLAGSTAATAPSGADARPLPQAASCSGVWVVVDYGSLGGIATQCATSFGNGTGALRGAGFSATLDEGFVLKINGKPNKPDINKAYWSYWHATGNNDGSYSDWTYSTLGANGYHPAKGNAEGWRYVSLGDGKVPPGAKPPTESSPTPTPTKTTSKPTPKPSPTRTPSTTRPTSTTTRKPTATASATRAATSASAKATTIGTAGATSSGPASTASSAAPTPEPSGESTAPTDAPVPASAEPETPADPGSPTGVIVTAGLVVVAGAGLGGWRWLKGRKP